LFSPNAMNIVEKVLHSRNRLREQYIWVLLPILFAICFINAHQAWATSQYRVFILLPTLFAFRISDWNHIWKNSVARWFLVLWLWMVITLLWDGLNHKDWQELRKGIQVLALFYLVYLVQRYQPSKAYLITKCFIWIGFLGALLIVKDWEGIKFIGTSWHHQESSRGVFSHHVYVGWILASLTISAFYCAIKIEQNGTFNVLLGLFYLTLTFFTQSRGGYLVLISGLLILLVLFVNCKKILTPVTLLATAAVFLIFEPLISTALHNTIERGMSGRIELWLSGISAVRESVWVLVFGHGLSVSANVTVNGFEAEHFHNFFLNLTYYCGLIGLVIYIGLLSQLVINFTVSKSLWGTVLIPMQAGFLVDGDSLFVSPSAIMLCIIVPISFLIFEKKEFSEVGGESKERVNANFGLIILFSIFVFCLSAWRLSEKLGKDLNFNQFSFGGHGDIKAIVVDVPETGVLAVDIDSWPESFGKAMPVLVSGVERPYPWKYPCDGARRLWSEGRVYLQELVRSNPEVTLKNLKREPELSRFRLEADVYLGKKSFSAILTEAGYVSLKGDKVSWCR